MAHFYQPDLGSEPDSPFARDGNNKLVRRGYWMDMNDRSLVMVMTQGIGAHLTNDEKRAHLTDLKREHLVDQVCIQEILPPDKRYENPPQSSGISATATLKLITAPKSSTIPPRISLDLKRWERCRSIRFSFDGGSDLGGESHEKRYRR